MVRPRNWGISNFFSENHRRCLPGSLCLFDIDGFFLDDSNNIIGLYEEKYKMETRDRGHFIKTFNDTSNLHAGFLKKISEKIPVWICEKSTQKWWILENGILSDSKNPDIHLYNTENRIYIEDLVSGKEMKKHILIGVFFRTEGEKNPGLENLVNYISDKLAIKKILVNDVYEKDNLFLKIDGKIFKIEEAQNKKWIDIWKKLGIIPADGLNL